ncbi:MAG: DUF11 domain-containing protein, partial [Cyanobacteria bacterium J06639_1]
MPAIRSLRCFASALISVAIAAGANLPAIAEGSRDFYPSGASGRRANIEWRTNQVGNPNFVGGSGSIRRRSIFQVYAKAGEAILLGSTANGVANTSLGTTGSILVFEPGRISGFVGSETIPAPDLDCNADQPGVGRITSRAQELAGPRSADGTGNLTGYTPCVYTAPGEGIYSIIFTGPNGLNNNANGVIAADVGLT